jgi:hypothetical protein
MCLSHLIYTVQPCLIHTCHAMPMPCSDHAVLLTARPCCGLEKNGMVGTWHGHAMASVNQTRPHCVNQMGKTHSKPLASRHDRGTAWTRHGNGMLCVNRPKKVVLHEPYPDNFSLLYEPHAGKYTLKYEPCLDKSVFLCERYPDKCRFLFQLQNIMVTVSHYYPDNYCRLVCNAVFRRLWGSYCLCVGSLECHIVKDRSCRIYCAAENPRSDDCRASCQVARDAVRNKAAPLQCWLIGPLCRLLVLFNEAASFSDRIALVILNTLLWSIGFVQSGENRRTRRKNLQLCQQKHRTRACGMRCRWLIA